MFVDETGRRARWAHAGLRGVFLLCLFGVGAVVVSLLGGVPLPGLTDPVQLPSDEPAHARSHQPNAAELPTPRAAKSMTPRSRLLATTSPGAGLTRSTPQPTAAASPTASPSGQRATPVASTSNPATTSPGSTARATTHRHTPTPANTRSVKATHTNPAHPAPTLTR